MPASPPAIAAAQIFVARTPHDGLQVDAEPHQTLLLSLEQGGSTWPNSCRNGTCRTCIGQLTHGRVRYEIEWPGITSEEQEEGFVLPCVAYPCSDIELSLPSS